MIIFLNGPSSSGKTTLARALQIISEKPLMLVGVDTFTTAFPPAYVPGGSKENEGFSFVQDPHSKEPLRKIKPGWLGKQIFSTRFQVIHAFAEQKVDLIVDEVLEMPHDLANYADALSNYTVYFVGVHCDLPTLIDRETLRENRKPGTARGQYELLELFNPWCDYRIDTTCASIIDSAKKLLDFIATHPKPTGFECIRKYHQTSGI